jgi:hypothetical protein
MVLKMPHTLSKNSADLSHSIGDIVCDICNNYIMNNEIYIWKNHINMQNLDGENISYYRWIWNQGTVLLAVARMKDR